MSFTTSLSGLSAGLSSLTTISNNLANLGTVGFKKSTAGFTSSVPAGSSGASGNTIGTGVNLSSVTPAFTQGNLESTGQSLDLAINGGGFFIYSDNGEQVYSRNGDLRLDNQGRLSNSQGQTLLGFQADANGNISGSVSEITIPTSNLQPRATQNINITTNLDSAAEVPTSAFTSGFTPGNLPESNTFNFSSGGTFYDSLGNQHTLTTYFVKDGTTPNTFNIHFGVDGQDVTPAGGVSLEFNENGTLQNNNPINISFIPGNGVATQSLSVDFTGSTQFAGGFSNLGFTQDGYSTGNLTNLEIDSSGVINANFSNGQSQTMGQVALARFSNPEGLQQLGDTTFGETSNSGSALVGTPGSNSLGFVQSGFLESSNVSAEGDLVSMILAQRNFQFNVAAIKTQDEITQTLINLRD